MKIQLNCDFESVIGMGNLLEAWKEFLKGKRNKRDTREFSLRLMDNTFSLHEDLVNHTYRHGDYQTFKINDPKPRNIHKAAVRDRLLHHAIHRILYPFFDRIFIADSFSCRVRKGTHAALSRFSSFAYVVSKNNTKTCWILKCDIQKFFASVNHVVLTDILSAYIPDKDILWLLQEVINSFSSTRPGIGLPLGNLTSQLFANIYMNEFDQFVKHKLKARYYVRYTDDFVMLSEDKNWLESLIPQINDFFYKRLRLKLHPEKVFIKTFASGIDFLGWIHFPDHRVLRTTTKRRMIKRIEEVSCPETINSYLGLLRHGNSHKIKTQILNNAFGKIEENRHFKENL